MKKTLALLLAVMMLISVFAGCGSSAAESTAAASSAEAAASAEAPAAEEAAEEAPAAEEAAPASAVEEAASAAEASAAEEAAEAENDTRVNYELPLFEDATLSIWYPIRQGRATFPSKDTPEAKFWTAAQENLGVDIEWVEVGQIVASEQYNLMVSSGDMCDLIYEGLCSRTGSAYTGGYEKAIEDEVYLDLSDYVEEYCPNYYYWININQDAHNAAYTDSGSIGSFATINVEASLQNMGMVINANYLDETGMDIPDTVDGWTDLFAAMKNNGVTAPCYATSSGAIMTGYIEEAMGATAEANFILDVAADEIIYGPTTDETRAYIELVTDYYAKGYIDENFMSIVSNDSSPFTSGTVGTWEAMGQELSTYEQSYGIPVEACPVVHSDGLEAGQTIMGSMSSDYVSDLPGMAVSADCDNLDVTLKFMDWFYSDDGALIANYGWNEGETYEVLEDGTYRELPFMEETDEATGCSNKGINTIIGDFGLVYPNISLELADDVQAEAAAGWTGDTEFKDFTYKTLPAALSLNSEESNAVASKISDMETVVESQILSWITGEEQLTDESWSAYLDKLEQTGLEDSLEAYNQAYQRYISK